MKHKIILALSLLIFLTSCERNEIDPINQLSNITEYNPLYMNFDYSYGYNDFRFFDGENITLEYSNSKITKKTANLILVNTSYNFIRLSIVEELTYKGNEIEIVRKSTDNTNIPLYQKRIYMNPDGKTISQIIIKNSSITDTLKFKYEGKNLDNITIYDKGIKSKLKFYYNQNQNLDSIITKYGNLNYNNTKGEYSYIYNETEKRRQKEVFSNFDMFINPMKQLNIFDDTFIRSLSYNNYKTYKRYFYDNDNVLRNFSEENWNFVYENNQINYAK